MRIYLETLGCRLNYAEMATLGRKLVAAGHQIASEVAQADLCVLNSCAVTAEAARKSRQLARQLARRNPGAQLVVTGCYATLESEAVAALPNVTLVVGNARKDELWALIDREAQQQATAGTKALPISSPQAGQQRTRAFVKVQDGCHNRCTFCIVTLARGDERSRSLTEVVDEVNVLHQEGYQEVVLTGVHLGAYGREQGGNLEGLIRELLRSTDIPRLRLSSLEPFDLTPDFFDLWAGAGARLMPHLHLPAQSGSDRVLRRMARRNRAGEFEALAAAARAAIPGLTLTTDLIAGFPGETEEDHVETLAFARRLGFAHIHAFPFSARPGTAAERLAPKLPEAAIRQRAQQLNALDGELGLAARQRFLGEVRPVLWEQPVAGSKTKLGATVTWSGLTDNYLPVRTALPAGVDLHNRILATRLVRLDEGDLWGEIHDGTERGTRDEP